jgi:hypothetical protein
MFSQNEIKKQKLTNLILLSFALFILAGALYSELFQAPKVLRNNVNSAQVLFPGFDFDSSTQIDLTLNKSQFTLKKMLAQNSWRLTNPLLMNVEDEKLNLFLTRLMGLKIMSALPLDEVNTINFSLKNPLMEIKIVDANKNANHFIVGLINSIDNSLYIAHVNKKLILQVELSNADLSELKIKDLSISTFLKQQIFSFEADQVTRAAITTDHVTHELVTEKLNAFVSALMNLKASFIFDRITENQNKILKEIVTTPMAELSFTENGQNYQFFINKIPENFPDLNLPNKNLFLFWGANQSLPLIVGPELLHTIKNF